MGGIDDDEDTLIINNLNVYKKTQTHSLNVDGVTQLKGVVSIDSTLFSKEFIIPHKESKLERGLYIKYNNTLNENELKIHLNNKENSIILNKNPLATLGISTDLFQFYNVQKNRSIYGNRVTGLNDPQYNSFSKYYVLQEYIFYEEETNITSIEYYMSKAKETVETVSYLKFTIEKYDVNDVKTIVLNNYTLNNKIKGRFYLETLTNVLKFLKGERIKISLIAGTNIDGSEVFCRLVGNSQIYPVINSLNIIDDIHNKNQSIGNALRVNGGGYFNESLFAKTMHSTQFLSFTGSHLSFMKNPVNYTKEICLENKKIYKSGLIVNVEESTKIDISNSKFELRLTNNFNDKRVFGVIQSYDKMNEYIINSLGEGGIWISNINGEIENGDYITSSIINGYGCKQNDDIMHNYTVAKCCSNINWNKVTNTIYFNNKYYKITFVACTYHCG